MSVLRRNTGGGGVVKNSSQHADWRIYPVILMNVFVIMFGMKNRPAQP
jgi:hypothetical protein